MVRQINPALARLYSSDLKRRYGSERGFEVPVNTPGQQRVLEILEEGLPDNQLRNLAKLASTTQLEVSDLLTRLGSLVRHSSALGAELTQLDVDQRFAELMRLYLGENIDPILALRNRARAEIFIESFSTTGLAIARGMSGAGFRKFHTLDQARVAESDTGALGHSRESLGKARARAAKEMLSPNAEVIQHSRITATLDRIGVAILIANDVIAPSSYQTWMARDTPHLAIVFTERGCWVSHLILPGITPCLGCLEVARAQRDPNWIATATQLSFLDRDLGDSASVFFAASIATSLASSLIDDQPLDRRIFQLDRQSMAVVEAEVAAANCGCRVVGSDLDPS
jgi:hypothetical protein